jgi:hypothetical protein
MILCNYMNLLSLIHLSPLACNLRTIVSYIHFNSVEP